MKKKVGKAKKQPTTVGAAKVETVLVLRTCNSQMRSHGGFVWPTSGPVSCPDWNAAPVCGGGLHGLLWGEGDGELLNWSDDARWLVVEVAAADVVEIDKQKCKFPRGTVVFCGKGDDAVAYLQARSPAGKICVGGTATAGDRGTATAGDGGTATAGYRGTATAGYRGTATAGYRGTATAGVGGTATAGYRGTATAGYRGTATAGDGGTATAGDGGEIRIRWWDTKTNRYRCAIGYVGEDGIEPKVTYLVVDGRLVKKS